MTLVVSGNRYAHLPMFKENQEICGVFPNNVVARRIYSEICTFSTPRYTALHHDVRRIVCLLHCNLRQITTSSSYFAPLADLNDW